MGGDGAMSMFAGLIDSSVERVRSIAADPRRFDRQEVARIADVWDNNSKHFFGILQVRPDRLRERLARRGLEWMAGPRAARRAWMVDHGGPALERLLGPAVPATLFFRDGLGQVRAGLLPPPVAGLDVDYDLPRARIVAVRVERGGAGFRGLVTLRAPRRFGGGEGDVLLHFTGVRLARFDSDDLLAAVVSDGAELRFGTAGVVLADEVTVSFDDPFWHLSRTARAVEAVALLKDRRPPVVPWAAAWEPGHRFRDAMVRVRQVRSPTGVSWVPLLELCDLLAGAGSRALAAGNLHGRARRTALHELAVAWGAEVPDLGGTADRVPDAAVLTLAAWHEQPSEMLANYALPAPGPPGWSLGAARISRPARVRLTCEGDVLSAHTR
ncbi:hypothetical protein Ait01nite_012920 [Actinoplanes italicus]|uniref:Uncharacterized protein n=1 Tax=Actinoplanes italicus TaxID=113567 RepID=A0A2T0KH04_9ACTN|nr:hypothetical protein [Actinoplanes italicus]PRX22725.1 hypothetical protein CLV67_104253 [Actinoplanes italicus]GIE28247.1 hypothetical protein Ait01nite_012920 [Actinoplanes italicus]